MTVMTGNCGCEAAGSDPDYDAFLARVNERFNRKVAGVLPLLTTDAAGLWEAYLGGFAPEFRQHNNCHACRNFIERFGGLVLVDGATGGKFSAAWDEEDAPDAYKPSIAAMLKVIRKSKVNGVFLSTEKVCGTPVTGPWHHFSVTLPDALVMKRSPVKTAGRAMAEKREDFGQVMRALDEFREPLVAQALTILRANALYRSEKVLGQAEWLFLLHKAVGKRTSTLRSNLVWSEVAKAPAGFCHPRASMIGTLLEDLAAGMDFDDVSRRFAAKMQPFAYQRPQAAPTAGAIAEAEKLVGKMGIARSLERRFLRVDEVQALWRPKPPAVEPRGDGVFAHLKPKGEAIENPLRLPEQTMTWVKFRDKVLPMAEKVELLVQGHDNYTALVTAVHPDAPPILQWDRENCRNPVSSYVWVHGSGASQWGLRANEWREVAAIALSPHQWYGNEDGAFYPHQGKGLIFVLDGAKESKGAGLALFPETLRAELHGVRSVIEAHSRTGKIQGMDEPHAAGLAFSAASTKTWGNTFRVTVCGVASEYKLDRWD